MFYNINESEFTPESIILTYHMLYFTYNPDMYCVCLTNFKVTRILIIGIEF